MSTSTRARLHTGKNHYRQQYLHESFEQQTENRWCLMNKCVSLCFSMNHILSSGWQQDNNAHSHYVTSSSSLQLVYY